MLVTNYVETFIDTFSKFSSNKVYWNFLISHLNNKINQQNLYGASYTAWLIMVLSVIKKYDKKGWNKKYKKNKIDIEIKTAKLLEMLSILSGYDR